MNPEEIAKLLHGPAALPPTGVDSNFEPSQRGATIVIIVVTFTACLITPIVVLRIYTRWFLIRRLSRADLLITIAFVLFAAMLVPVIRLIPGGVLMNQWDYRLESIPEFAFNFNLIDLFYDWVLIFLQAGIMLEYLAIFVPRHSKPLVYWFAWILIGCNCVNYIIMSGLHIAWCLADPTSMDPLAPKVNCSRLSVQHPISGALNTISDLYILLLPQGVIWKLKLPRNKKILISLLFMGGLFACLSSILRIVFWVKMERTDNITYNSVVIGLLTLPEVLMGFVAACVPVLPRFFQEIRLARRLKRWFGFGKQPPSSQDQNQLLRCWPGSVSMELGGLDSPRVGISHPMARSLDPRPIPDLRSCGSSMVGDGPDDIPPMLQMYGITKTIEISTTISQHSHDAASAYDPRQDWDYQRK